MFKQENPNFVASKYAPNPQEVSYWIDLMADSSGNVIKSYTGEKWIPLNRDANVDQWTHIREIVESVGLTFDRDSDIISLPSFDSNNYFKGDSVVEAINNGDAAVKSEVDRLDDKIDAVDDDLQEFKSTKGQPGGLAELDDTGKVPASQLPSYVDDVVDVYATFNMSEVGMLDNIQLYKDPEHTIPVIGERDKIYINCTEGQPGYQFRWSGTQWVHIDSNALIIGEVPGTAFDGARGKHLEDIEKSMPKTLIANVSNVDRKDNQVILMFGGISKLADGTWSTSYDFGKSIGRANNDKAGVLTAADYTMIHKNDLVVGSLPSTLLSNINSLSDAQTVSINVVAVSYSEQDGMYSTDFLPGVTIEPATTTVAGVMTGADRVMLDSTLPDAIRDEQIAREAAVTALEAKDIELKQDITDLDTTVNADITTLRSTILKVNDATGLTEDNAMPDMSSTNYLNGSPSMVSSTVTLDHKVGELERSVQWTRLAPARYAVDFNELYNSLEDGRYAHKLVYAETPSHLSWEGDHVVALGQTLTIPEYTIKVSGIPGGDAHLWFMAYEDADTDNQRSVVIRPDITEDGTYVIPSYTSDVSNSNEYILRFTLGVVVDWTEDSKLIIEQVKL